MKKTVFLLFSLFFLIACNKNNDPQKPSDNPSGGDDTSTFRISLSYDSVANTISAIPSDSTVEYVMTIWMVEDYKIDYGNDFSDAHIKESLQSWVDDCIGCGMGFPLFRGRETQLVYEFFDHPYPGEEFIAMAGQFDSKTKKIVGSVFHINFTTLK